MNAPTENPLESSKARIVIAAIVFVSALAVYGLTLAPTVTLVDSGELIVVAHTLGVAHPPGFPLYTLLAHAATLIPIGSVAARVNFASAIFAALAAATLTLVVAEALLIAARFGRVSMGQVKKSKRGKKRKPSPPSKTETRQPVKTDSTGQDNQSTSSIIQSSWLVSIVPCLVAGLLFAFSRTLWAYATIAEVYTLNALLILVLFFLMFRWRREVETRRHHDAATPRTASRESKTDVANDKAGDKQAPRLRVYASTRHKWLYIAALVFGLALGVHHVTVGLMLIALAYLVYATEGIRFFTSKGLAYAALFAFSGLLVYAYLPVAASNTPVMNWGDPKTLERFWWHVTGRQYQSFLDFSAEVMIGQLSQLGKYLMREFGPLWLPVGLALALTGLLAIFKRDRILFWFLILVVFGDLLYALNYEIAEDKDAYYLPVFIALAIATAFGAQWIIESVKASRLPAPASRFISFALIMSVPVVALAGNLPFNNRSRYFIAKDYVENVFKTVESNGLLLTGDWQLYSPMFYLQQIEKQREDVIAIDVKLLRRYWYYDYLSRDYPQLIEATRDKVDAFLEDLKQWEQTPDLYNRDIALNQRINRRFFDMILAFVSSHISSGPVYVTHDIASGIDSDNNELTKALNSNYQLVPQGLVFEVTTDMQFRDPSEPELQMRGLTDGAIKFEKDDTAMLKVLPAYWIMHYFRGAYLARNNQHERAAEAFRKALELAPDNPQIKQSLNASLSALRGQSQSSQ